jgi:hypothetical protein
MEIIENGQKHAPIDEAIWGPKGNGQNIAVQRGNNGSHVEENEQAEKHGDQVKHKAKQKATHQIATVPIE